MVELAFESNGEVENKRLLIVIFGIVYITLLFVLVVFSTAANAPTTEEGLRPIYRTQIDTANMYINLFYLGLIAILLASISKFIAFAPVGSKEQIANGLLLGVGIALIGFFINIFIIRPQSIFGLTEPLGFFYVSLASPVVEEAFFRGALPYTIFLYTKNFIVSAVIPLILFVGFHYFFINQGQPGVIESYAATGIIATALLLITGSWFSNFSFHFTINTLFRVFGGAA